MKTPATKERDLKVAFLKIYANLPFEERKQVIVVVDDEPISWDLARNEIIHSTTKGEQIIKLLAKLNII